MEFTKHEDVTHTNLASNIIIQMSSMSAYWVSFLLQRNLGATIDLIQLLRLTYGSFERRFLSPTVRAAGVTNCKHPTDCRSSRASKSKPAHLSRLTMPPTTIICSSTRQPLS
jgi:hypothetical protein